jgi:hypothetical protein
MLGMSLLASRTLTTIAFGGTVSPSRPVLEQAAGAVPAGVCHHEQRRRTHQSPQEDRAELQRFFSAGSCRAARNFGRARL